MTDNKRPITEEDGIHKEWYKQAKAQTLDTLQEFLRHLTEDYVHDYGTICHAVAASGVAAMNAVNHSPTGGITGFQAGAVMWEVIRAWNAFGLADDVPMRIVHYDNLLYPQYADKFALTISRDTWGWVQARAQQLIAGGGSSHPEVQAHWQSIVDGQVPFGLTVKEDGD